jgi:hypothetical protein
VRPAFPTPSFFLGEQFMHNSGVARRGIAEAYLDVIDKITPDVIDAEQSSRDDRGDAAGRSLSQRRCASSSTQDIRDHSNGSAQHVEISRVNRTWNRLAGGRRRRCDERAAGDFA